MHVRFVWLSVIVCLSLGRFVWAGPPLAMKDAVEKGLAANPSILAAREALMASDYAVTSAKAAFAPSMTSQYGFTRLNKQPQFFGTPTGSQNNWALTLNVHQPLFVGFSLLTSYQKTVLQKEQATSQIEDAEVRLTVAIQDAFLRLLQAKEDVRQAQDALDRLQEHLRVNVFLHEVGFRPKLDMLQAEVEVAKAEQALLAANTNVATVTAELNTLLGQDVNAQTHYTGALDYFPLPLNLAECLQRAMEKRADLRIAKQTVVLAEKDTTLASAAFYPQVGADFNYTWNGDTFAVKGDEYDSPNEWNAQVGLQWTFFEWGKTFYSRKQAQKNTDRLREEYKKLENDALFEVKRNFLQITQARKRITSARQGLVAARESFRIAKARYGAQVGANTDVLDAQSALTASEASVTAALSDYERAVAALYGTMGEKNPELLPR